MAIGKLVLWRAAKALGLFALARRLTGASLRILCYHGVALGEEWRFNGNLFCRRETFASRMALLRRLGYPVLSLDDALERRSRDIAPAAATVVTIDDGWAGTYIHALPILETHGIPATVYATTYYMKRQSPVITVAIGYALWFAARAGRRSVELPDGLGVFDLPVRSRRIREFAETRIGVLTIVEQYRYLERLFDVCGVDRRLLSETRMFRLMTREEIADMARRGIDVQLHSHRHRFPVDDRDFVERDLKENIAFLEPLMGRPLRHFCYPSGIFAVQQREWLKALGIVSATTLLPGLNEPDADPYILSRINDGDEVLELEFEAELSGLPHLLRRARDRFMAPLDYLGLHRRIRRWLRIGRRWGGTSGSASTQ